MVMKVRIGLLDYSLTVQLSQLISALSLEALEEAGTHGPETSTTSYARLQVLPATHFLLSWCKDPDSPSVPISQLALVPTQNSQLALLLVLRCASVRLKLGPCCETHTFPRLPLLVC